MVFVSIQSVEVCLHTAGSGASRRRADGTEATEGGHEKIRLVYREEFADRGMSYEFDKRAWHLFLY